MLAHFYKQLIAVFVACAIILWFLILFKNNENVDSDLEGLDYVADIGAENSQIEENKETRLENKYINKETNDKNFNARVSDSEYVLVFKVFDGDTIKLENGEVVRYIGIDTPEISHPLKPVGCFGIEAKIKNKEIVEGKLVRLEKDVSDRDKYGRLLRYVWVGDVFVNDYLVRQGYAYAYTYPPDVRYSAQFAEAQREARKNKKGLWSKCLDKD